MNNLILHTKTIVAQESSSTRVEIIHERKWLPRVACESDTSAAIPPFVTTFRSYCIPGNSGPHSWPHTFVPFSTGLHSLNSKLNPPSGLLDMTDVVNIVESVCQDTGRPFSWQNRRCSQNTLLRPRMRPLPCHGLGWELRKLRFQKVAFLIW